MLFLTTFGKSDIYDQKQTSILKSTYEFSLIVYIGNRMLVEILNTLWRMKLAESFWD